MFDLLVYGVTYVYVAMTTYMSRVNESTNMFKYRSSLSTPIKFIFKMIKIQINSSTTLRKHPRLSVAYCLDCVKKCKLSRAF